MKNIQAIAAKFPNVGVHLSASAQTLRGQLYSLGFSCQDSQMTEGLNWLLSDSNLDLKSSPPGLPVLHADSKMSIYHLKQAIIALFNQAA